MELSVYKIPDGCRKYCSMSQYLTGNQTKNASRHKMKIMPFCRTTSIVDLTGISACRATSFECL